MRYSRTAAPSGSDGSPPAHTAERPHSARAPQGHVGPAHDDRPGCSWDTPSDTGARPPPSAPGRRQQLVPAQRRATPQHPGTTGPCRPRTRRPTGVLLGHAERHGSPATPVRTRAPATARPGPTPSDATAPGHHRVMSAPHTTTDRGAPGTRRATREPDHPRPHGGDRAVSPPAHTADRRHDARAPLGRTDVAHDGPGPAAQAGAEEPGPITATAAATPTPLSPSAPPPRACRRARTP
ncbi:hypothetical protein SCANM124S_05550 [Streptomyces canus]